MVRRPIKALGTRTALYGLLLAAAPGLCATAAPTSCPADFFRGQAPDLLNPKLATGAAALCFSAFAVEHSAATRTPLWSAEHLTADRIAAARQLPREGEFHAEEALPPGQGADLEDYARSGYDRGHMAPNGDMPTPAAQAESFSLANMIPQAPKLNRGLWEGIESSVRDLAVQDGEVYVVTGPIFQGGQVQALHGRVLVPNYVFKAVYDPARGQAGAYLTRNANGTGYEVISITQLAQVTGIDVFPSLPARTKAQAAALPPPSHSRGHRHERRMTFLENLTKTLFGEAR